MKGASFAVLRGLGIISIAAKFLNQVCADLYFRKKIVKPGGPRATASHLCPDGLGRPQGELSGTQYSHRQP
jgi:hypothetical protein